MRRARRRTIGLYSKETVWQNNIPQQRGGQVIVRCEETDGDRVKRNEHMAPAQR